MPVPRVLGPALILLLVVSACGSSSAPTTTEGFFVPERRIEMGVAPACLDLADEYLMAVRDQVGLLGDLDFAGWINDGLFYVEDEAPDLSTRFREVSDGYQSNECPTGYLSATIVAHGDRFELRSPGAAIWWASIVAASAGMLGAGAQDEEQRTAWVALAGADENDISSRAVIPDLDEIGAISDCQTLAQAANDLFQQQLYLISAVPYLEEAGDALAPLAPATEQIERLMTIGECQQAGRESLLRRAHEIEFAGPGGVISFATEIDAAWGFWSEEELAPEVELGVNLLDEEAGTVEVVLGNIGNLPVRVISIKVDDVLTDGLRIALDPGDVDEMEVTLTEPPSDSVAVEIMLLAPTGATQSVSTSVRLS